MCGSDVAGSDRRGGAVTATSTVDPRVAGRRPAAASHDSDHGAPPAATPRSGQPAAPSRWATVTRRPARVGAGQIVAAQLAVVLPLAALGRGAVPLAGALVAAVLLLALAWVRFRGRWLFEWSGTHLAYLSRRRALPAEAGDAALLDLVAPGATVLPSELAGVPAAVLDDATGVTALLELGDPGELLGGAPRALPTPAALLSAATSDGPPVRVQVVLSASPAPAPEVGGAVGTSYRQLTDGRLAARERAVLAVRVLRVDGWAPDDLRQALAGAVRRVVRRLRPLGVRPLGAAAALRVLAEVAHHDAAPVREHWTTVRAGGSWQATFQLDRWPDARGDGLRGLVSRLLTLPATATTVALCAGPGADPAALTVRLAAGSPGALVLATRALHTLVEGLGAEVRRLDGAHGPGLAATVPLALEGPPPRPQAAPEALDLPLGGAGLLLGANRHGTALAVRLFRPEGTRALLVGGVRLAQLVALRAMALGARVVVQTTRPRTWEPFVRGVGAPGGTIPLLPPGRPLPDVTATPLRPLLLVVDVGPVPADATPDPPWSSTLVVRDGLTSSDVDVLGRADLAVLQPLTAGEAALAGTALGLGDAADWLTRVRDDMVAVVNRRALRWVLLSLSSVEAHLVGRPSRH
ncbi:type VII secretion protein EccE [Micromonospora costi]|uniref:type VII secretion protein EccE n=1 Tax=Micromonospora costi TaxID=1530042 RepID=UPI003F4D64E7